MADVVQFRLERMADELDDLERRGLFSRSEIAEIVRRRRDFEYRLKRPSPLKPDYIAYIDYEKQLNALRDLRKRAIIGRLRDEEAAVEDGGGSREEEKEGVEVRRKRKKRDMKGKKWKKSISDVAGVMRILDIYRLAVMRYKGDLALWFQYVEFCRERRHGRMKQVLAQAIRYHPKVPGLWIYAAAWEFDQNLNVTAARALMQSSLRACPKSEDLWIEYLRMEITYLNKLKARKLALGEDLRLKQDDEENKQWKEENKDLFMSLNDAEEVTKESVPLGGALEKKEDLFWQHGPKILQTIYHGAVEALPSSISLRKRFLEILDDIDLAHSEALKEDIMIGLKKDFSHDERYWDWLARLHISDTRKRNGPARKDFLLRLNKAIEVYEEALKFLPSTEMFSLYTKFLSDMIVPDQEDSSSMLSNVAFEASDFILCLLKVYERAEISGYLTEDLAERYICCYLQIGRLEEARNLAEKLCNDKFSKATNLWNMRALLEIKWLTNKASLVSKDGLHSVHELLRNALIRLPVSEAERFWLMAMKLFSNEKKHFLKLVQILRAALSTGGDNECGYSIASAIVNWVLQIDGIQHAREMYKRFLVLPHPSLAFFKHCIELELNLASVEEFDGCIKARKLYESALRFYADNRELWRDYYTMEMKLGTSGTANAVYWRARKVLKDATGLSVPSTL